MRWPFAFALVIFAILWELATTAANVPQYIIPRLSVIWADFLDHYPAVLNNTWVTGVSAVAGGGLGIAAGLLVAVVLVQLRVLRNALWPFVVGLNSVPVVAVAPLVAIWFGHGWESKALVAAFICFFPVTVSFIDGAQRADREYCELFDTLGVRGLRRLALLKIPGALPQVISGLKATLALATIGAIVAEFIGADAGLGYGMVQASSNLNTPRLFVYMFAAVGLGLLLYWIGALTENALRKTRRFAVRV